MTALLTSSPGVLGAVSLLAMGCHARAPNWNGVLRCREAYEACRFAKAGADCHVGVPDPDQAWDGVCAARPEDPALLCVPTSEDAADRAQERERSNESAARTPPPESAMTRAHTAELEDFAREWRACVDALRPRKEVAFLVLEVERKRGQAAVSTRATQVRHLEPNEVDCVSRATRVHIARTTPSDQPMFQAHDFSWPVESGSKDGVAGDRDGGR
jgi:hypothetical protein